jgi:hypothetical protein
MRPLVFSEYYKWILNLSNHATRTNSCKTTYDITGSSCYPYVLNPSQESFSNSRFSASSIGSLIEIHYFTELLSQRSTPLHPPESHALESHLFLADYRRIANEKLVQDSRETPLILFCWYWYYYRKPSVSVDLCPTHVMRSPHKSFAS